MLSCLWDGAYITKNLSASFGLDIVFNTRIQSKLLKHMFVVGASSDLAQPFH